jgi:hypothetical protein
VDWSWVETLAEVEEAREHARRLIGLRLAAVRYASLDYFLWDRPDGSRGPRLVTSEDEWRVPPWQYEFGDSVDYGVEFETTCGRLFTVTWDSPGWHEGIYLREVSLIAEAAANETTVAVWNVSRAGRWDHFVGPEVGDVHLAYKPWAPDDGYWCSRITVSILDRGIELLLGEGEADQQLHPAADNIAVLFPPSRLPDWERPAEPESM